MRNLYQKASGSAGSKGVDFQINLLIVFLLNALENFREWKLSTENKLAGKFDDIVLEIPDHGAILLQAKHKENRKITWDQLFSTNSKNDYFSLPKYFLSYLKIKTNFPVKYIIICTNTYVESKILNFLNGNNQHQGILQYEGCSSFYTFNENMLADLITNTRIYCEHNLQGKGFDATTITEEKAKEFLSHLQLYLNYPSGNDLEKVIDKLLADTRSLTNLLRGISHENLHKKVKEWFEQPKGEYLTNSRARAMFCEIKSEKYCELLENYKIFFRLNNLSDGSSSNKKILHVIAKEDHLFQSIKIYRSFQKDTKILYASPDYGQNMQVHMIEAFKLPAYTYLIIIAPKFTNKDLINKLNTILVDTLATLPYKKVIFVTELYNKLVDQLFSSHYYAEINSFVCLKNLCEDSRSKLLNKKSVIFQGEEISLAALFRDQLTTDIMECLDSEILDKLVRGEKITVGEQLTVLEEEFSKCYVQRMFERTTDNLRDENESANKIKKILNEQDLLSIKEKIILISDSAGSGKTTTLKHLALSIKKSSPHLWVIGLELNGCTKTMRSTLRNRRFIRLWELINLKDDTTNSMNQLAKILFSLKEMVVLLLDGVDEISPDYTSLILNLLIKSQRAKNLAKVFITTRPCTTKQLLLYLNIPPYKLASLTRKDQIDFFTNYWMHNLQLKDESSHKCKNYAENLITNISFLISNWYSGEENQFMMIPLHVRMLAEIFMESKESMEWEGCRDFLKSEKSMPNLPKRINIGNLYKMFIEKKRDIFISKGNPTGNTMANKALSDQFEECLAYHRSLALNTLFYYKQRDIFSRYQLDVNDKETNMLKIGIVQRLNEELCFIHRTFAEYFLAEIIFRELQQLNRDVDFQEFLIDNVFYYWKFNIIRYFLNGFLHDLRIPLHPDIFKSYKSTKEFKIPGQNRTFQFSQFCCVFGHFLEKEEKKETLYNTVDRMACLRRPSYIQNNYMEATQWVGSDTIIHRLAFEGNTEILRLLLTSIKFQVTNNFRSSFKFFIKRNTLSILESLMRSDGVNIKNIYQETPLHQAVIGNSLETVKFLMDMGADFRMRDDSGNTPLLMAANKDRWEITEFFLKSGVDFTVRDTQGNQVLHSAAKNSKDDIIKLLLDYGMDIESINNNGRTALHFAAQKGSENTVCLLLRRGANINKVDKKGRTTLHLAVLIGRQNIVALLIEHDIKVNIADDSGRTALHFAVECDNIGIVELLIKHQMNFNIADIEGQTALHLAVLRGRQNIVECLVTHGLEVNTADKQGRTALHAAVGTGKSNIVEFLLDHGADISTRDKEGSSLLHIAAEFCDCDVVQFLLKCGMDFNNTDKHGRTPLDIAILNNRKDIVDCLQGHDVLARNT